MTYANEIKSLVTMEQVARFYGLEINRSGFCRCPFHNERTASLKIYSGQGGFHCFGCGAHGSVIDFVEKFFDLSFSDSVVKINADFSLGLPIGKKLDRRQQIDAGRKAFLRRKEMNREKQERERLKNNLDEATAAWIQLDRQRMAHLPADGAEPDQIYIDALKRLPLAENILDEAEMRLYNYEHRNR